MTNPAEVTPRSSETAFLNCAMRALSQPFVWLVQRFMPDAFIFATLLSVLTFVLAITLTETTSQETVNAWGGGFWKLQTFTAQIAMTLMTGFALAHTPAVHKLLKNVAALATTPQRAYVLVCFVACLASLISWGMGLIVGAIIARETATICFKRGVTVHYPLLVAAGYTGYAVWHQGLSSSIGLSIATAGHPLEKQIGVIPVTESLLTHYNIIIALVTIATLPFVMSLIRPPREHCDAISPELIAEDIEEVAGSSIKRTPAQHVDNAWLINLTIGAAGIFYLWLHFGENGGSINLNIVNFMFLISGLLLSRSPIHYIELIKDAGRSIGPILLQYPFYAGIMGIMTDTGLVKVFAEWFASISTAATLPFWAMISGGIINMFVPSGGGQWAVQGPVMVEAAKSLGADIPRVAMGVALGDQWSNMIQPFWTIPALAVAGLKVRDIMGYTVIAFFWTGLVFGLGILFL